MNNKRIAPTAGKAPGLPAYHYGAEVAVDTLGRVQTQARAGDAVTPFWLADALNGLAPESRRSCLVAGSDLVATRAVANDFARHRRASVLMDRKITEGNLA